jgi:hypothetical protein
LGAACSSQSAAASALLQRLLSAIARAFPQEQSVVRSADGSEPTVARARLAQHFTCVGDLISSATDDFSAMCACRAARRASGRGG